MNDEKKPKEYDAVLGGNNPPPIDGLVLGGIEGVKRRLQSNNIEVIKTALSDAIAYKGKGLDLVINTLYNSPQEIRQYAVKILRENKTVKVEQALLDYDPRSLFIQFDDWNLKTFNLESYLNDPLDTAYRIDLKNFNEVILELQKIEPQGSKLECLYCPMLNDHYRYEPFETFIKYLIDAHQQLNTLKVLFLADESDDRGERRWEYKRYKVYLDEVSYLLEAYPKLEFLRLQGRYGLDFNYVKHNCLKSLIIETRELSYSTLEKIAILDLPQLEYLELWLGADRDYQNKKYRNQKNELELLTKLLMPLLFEDSFPNLKYLGLCSCEWADDLVDFLKDCPILQRLRLLNLSRGTLTDEGAEILLNCSAINHLHTLDVSMNLLTSKMINKLSQLDCNVMAKPQEKERSYWEDCGRNRYSALYE